MAKFSFDKIIVIIAVVTGSMLQLIDSSIVNVSLTQMMGNLGATIGDVSWVVTGYTTSTIIMITLSGWLSAKLGRKNYFTASIILFTIASVFCGTSTTIEQLVIFRIIQGIGGGGLLATAQAILIDTFPRKELGTANAIFGMGVIIGPSIGPTLGGYITDHLSWHWIFYVNIPVGILAAILSILYVKDSKYKIKTGNMDWLALVLLILTIGSLQIILEKGQSEDWFQTKYITILAITSVLAGIYFVRRQLKVENPILNLRLLKNYQYTIGTLFGFVQGIGLYASIFIIPVFCQSMLGYTAQDTGLLMLPGSLAAGLMMPVVALIMKKTKISPIVLAGIGFLSFVLFVWLLSGMNLNTNADSFFWPLILRGVGLGLLFIPLLTITIYPLHNKDIPQATAFTTMVRQLGGAFGIALATTYLSVRSTFHYANLSDHISIYNQTTIDRINSYTHFFMSKGSDFIAAKLQAIMAIKGAVYQQAMILTYNDIFIIVGVFFAICIPFLLLFRIKNKNVAKAELNAETHFID
ncbi:DHA2 family efflux MFS transporter permease subunit [bacterium]|nr:MAG: DHA2 family efflux MFS transporter permease subunit [bacterium]